jgi:hypothetical protein
MRTPATDIDIANAEAAIAALDDAPSRGYQMLHAPEVSAQDLGYHRLAAEVVTLAIRDFIAAQRTGKEVRLGASTAGLPAAAAGKRLAEDADFALWCSVLDADPQALVDGALAALASGGPLALRRYGPRETAGDDHAA